MCTRRTVWNQAEQHFAAGGLVQAQRDAHGEPPHARSCNQAITINAPTGQVSRATEMQLTAAAARGARPPTGITTACPTSSSNRPRFRRVPLGGLYLRARVPGGDHAPRLGRGEAQPRVGLSAGATDASRSGRARRARSRTVLEFWHVRAAGRVGFRVKDYSDYQVVPRGADAARPPTSRCSRPDVGGTYQLEQALPGRRRPGRQSRLPGPADLQARRRAPSLLSGAGTVDYTTGLVTGSAGGTAGFEFDVPVRFDGGFPVEIVARQIQSVQLCAALNCA